MEEPPPVVTNFFASFGPYSLQARTKNFISQEKGTPLYSNNVKLSLVESCRKKLRICPEEIKLIPCNDWKLGKFLTVQD